MPFVSSNCKLILSIGSNRSHSLKLMPEFEFLRCIYPGLYLLWSRQFSKYIRRNQKQAAVYCWVECQLENNKTNIYYIPIWDFERKTKVALEINFSQWLSQLNLK